MKWFMVILMLLIAGCVTRETYIQREVIVERQIQIIISPNGQLI
jgi:hypothetical protein